MLICVLGPAQSGKATLAEHLVSGHGFIRVHLGPRAPLSDSPSSLSFSSSSDFLDHVTQTWRRDYVTTDLHHHVKLVEFAKRPFVAIVSVQAPLGVRFERAVATATRLNLPVPSLSAFIAADDLLLYGPTPTPTSPVTLPVPLPTEPPSTPKKKPSPTLLALDPPSPTPSPFRTPLPSSTLPKPPLSEILHALPLQTLSNPYSSLPPFHSSISLALPFLPDLLRPPWDSYFMRLASLASLRSNCMKRRVGCVLVRERRVVATGYNGTPRGVRNCNEGGCGRCNGEGDGLGQGGGEVRQGMGVGLEECLCLHAEENALLEVGRDRVSGGGTPGAVLYCNTCPCLRCAIRIVQCGVSEVVYSLAYATDAASRRVLEEGKVSIRQIPLPAFAV